MGVVLSDLVVESVIRDGLASIRDDDSRLEDLFENYNATYLKDTMGWQAINQVKDFIKTNQVNIVQSFIQAPSALPCFSIQLAQASEDRNRAVLSDNVGSEITIEDSEVLVSMTPTSYDSNTGILFVPGSTDLSDISVGMMFQDTTGTVYEIEGGIIDTVPKQINIGVGESPSIAGICSIVSNLDFSRNNINMIPINENIQIGVHSKDAATTKILYYILIYIFQIKRDSFIKRGLTLTAFSASDFGRESNFLPENTYSRFVTLNAITRLYYKSKTDDLADNIGIIVRVPKDEVHLPDETEYTVQNTLP